MALSLCFHPITQTHSHCIQCTLASAASKHDTWIRYSIYVGPQLGNSAMTDPTTCIRRVGTIGRPLKAYRMQLQHALGLTFDKSGLFPVAGFTVYVKSPPVKLRHRRQLGKAEPLISTFPLPVEPPETCEAEWSGDSFTLAAVGKSHQAVAAVRTIAPILHRCSQWLYPPGDLHCLDKDVPPRLPRRCR